MAERAYGFALAIGELYHDKWDCRETIENQYVNYLRPDVNHCGGISEMKKIAAMAEVTILILSRITMRPTGVGRDLARRCRCPTWHDGGALGEWPRIQRSLNPSK